MSQATINSFEETREAIIGEFEKAKQLGQEVLYQDETGFSRTSYKRKTYGQSAIDMEVNQHELNQNNITASASVSASKGLVYLKIQEKGMGNENFNDYIRELSKKMEHKPFFLFLDNL
jgi:purine-nucleoside phosphorylase